MVHVDMMITTTAGAVLAGLAVKAPLASAINPASHMMRALLTTDSMECVTEANACAADDGCLGCSAAYSGEAEPCAESLASGGLTDICDLVRETFCCATEGCWDNAAYAELLECSQGAQEDVSFDCPVTDITACTGGGTVDSTSPFTDDDTSPTATDRDISPVDSTTTPTDGTAGDFGSPDLTTADGSTTDTAEDSTTSVCQAEDDACRADSECSSCAETLAAQTDAVAEVCRGADYDSETATCAEKSEVGCCNVEEGPECIVDNDAMAALIDCIAASEGCSDFSVLDCEAGGDGSESLPFLGGDDEADVVDADEDDADADAAGDTGTDSAPPSAVIGGTAAVVVAAAVSLAFVNA